MTILKASESITFQEAIALTHSLLEQMASNSLSETEIMSAIAALVKTMNGARGFFVTYLTDDRSLADSPSNSVVVALKSSPDLVSELLVKNLAMSTAMAITHRRNSDENSAQGSDRVCRRSIQLIQKLQLEESAIKLQELYQSIVTGAGSYQDFLERWGYNSDREQLQAIKQAIETL
jgi:hypothetical protein